MKILHLILSCLALFACSSKLSVVDLSSDQINKKINLTWNYNYSSDVFYGEIIGREVYRASDDCEIPYVTVKIIESFKGSHQRDHFVDVTSTGMYESDSVGSHNLFFLKPFEITNYPGYGKCASGIKKNFFSVHNWCCSIVDTDGLFLVMSDMLNSEQKSDNYLVSANSAFELLRKLRDNSKSNLLK